VRGGEGKQFAHEQRPKKGWAWYVNDRLRKVLQPSKFNRVPPNSHQLTDDADEALDWINKAGKNKTIYKAYQVPVDKLTGLSGTPVVTAW
jgi:hypothetical protein